jgi:hypothetical protein
MYLVLIGRNGLDLKSISSRSSSTNGSFPSYGHTAMRLYGRCPDTDGVNSNFARYSRGVVLTQISPSSGRIHSLVLEHSNSCALN